MAQRMVKVSTSELTSKLFGSFDSNAREIESAFGVSIRNRETENGNAVVIDGEGEDSYVVFKVQVPTGSRDGDAYDAYGLAQEYEMKQAEKKEKAEKAAKEKAAKIARDQKMREQKAAAKAAHNA